MYTCIGTKSQQYVNENFFFFTTVQLISYYSTFSYKLTYSVFDLLESWTRQPSLWKGQPMATHSLCMRDWNPSRVRKCLSSKICTRLDIRQQQCRLSGSVKYRMLIDSTCTTKFTTIYANQLHNCCSKEKISFADCRATVFTYKNAITQNFFPKILNI